LKRNLLIALAALVLACLAAYYAAPALFTGPLHWLHRSASGLAAHQVSAAGHTLHYLDSGKASDAMAAQPPVVLLHGIFAEKDHWVDFARPLTKRYRVIAPDLPGFGESTRHENQPYDYAAQVERLRSLLDALEVPRAHLAGSSMGGTLAALFALRYPDRVASVAFIGSPHGLRSATASDMDRLIEAGKRPLVAHDTEAFNAMMALIFAQRPFLPHPIMHASEQGALRMARSNERIWDEQLKDRYLLQERLPALPHPTLALWGEEDRVFHRSGADTLATLLSRARIDRLPGIGHLPMMEDAAGSAARYAAFLAR